MAAHWCCWARRPGSTNRFPRSPAGPQPRWERAARHASMPSRADRRALAPGSEAPRSHCRCHGHFALARWLRVVICDAPSEQEPAMSFAPENRFPSSDRAAPESLLNLPVGLASPLWGLFAGAAMTGAAWWWMTRWARPENLEAMFGAALEPEARTFAPAVAAATEPEKAGPVAETVAEALTEAPLPAAPVGGEAAPISP